MSVMDKLSRTSGCGQVTEEMIEAEVTLMGWVQRSRDHGGVIFIDLRDRSGLVQVVVDSQTAAKAFQRAEKLRKEYVIAVKGRVKSRPEGMVNEELATGSLEIEVESLHILDEAKTPPFLIADQVKAGEELRLEYRYLDLRRQPMQENIKLRHDIKQAVRDYLNEAGFLEIETPILTKSTPEGARDFLVPSRNNQGKFFALPQSPQLFKQLLMVSGLEKYYQIARCFRDEDLRADRQPEFTQIDLEASFVDQESLMSTVEGMMEEIFAAAQLEVPTEFPRLSYQEAVRRFGTDRPDTRFGLELVDISDLVAETEFNVFSGTVADGGQVKGIKAPGAADFSRGQLDDLTDFVAVYGAQGLAWLKVTEAGVKSPIAKFLSAEELSGIKERFGAEPGDLLLFVADKPDIVADALANLRLKLGAELDLIPTDEFNFVWVTDFPLFEWDKEENRYVSAHHPFTMPATGDIDRLQSAPEEVKAQAYDLVLNGIEIGGGSLRIHDQDLQLQVFDLLNMSQSEVEEKFGFLLEAFEYGTPPHGGIAFGLDRLVMLLGGRETIRDVIPFPKTQRGTCPLTDAPARVSETQLEELNIKAEKEIKIE